MVELNKSMLKLNQKQHGFTLLEILLVVGLIAVLAGIVIFAINPSRQLADARDSQRKVDVNTILNAVYQYAIDNRGTMPFTGSGEICKTGADSCSGLIDLGVLTDSNRYLVAIPYDPSDPSANGTGYTITLHATGRVTVTATYGENSEIAVTR
jgi:prepilin-type N-terminal cleavage/methylation domain-containing protein